MRRCQIGLLVLAGLFAGCGRTAPQPPGQAGPDAGDGLPLLAPGQIPDAPVSGSVLGRPFTPDAVKLGARALTFRVGSAFNGYVEVRIEARRPGVLRPDLEMDVARDAQDPPSVTLKSFDPGLSHTTSATYGDDYTMRLSLAPGAAGRVAGKVYLAVPDQQRSAIRGTFTADDVREDPAAEPLGPADAPCIYGRVAVRGDGEGPVGAEFAGVTGTGERAWGAITARFVPESRVGNTTFRPQVSQLEIGPDRSCNYHHVSMKPGKYLVSAHWNGRPADWRWVEVAAGSRLRVDFAIEPTATGRLEVSVPPALARERVSVVPADAGGLVPVPVAAVSSDQKREASPVDGRAVFDGLAPGTYRVYAGSAQAAARVGTNETSRVELK